MSVSPRLLCPDVGVHTSNTQTWVASLPPTPTLLSECSTFVETS